MLNGETVSAELYIAKLDGEDYRKRYYGTLMHTRTETASDWGNMYFQGVLFDTVIMFKNKRENSFFTKLF